MLQRIAAWFVEWWFTHIVTPDPSEQGVRTPTRVREIRALDPLEEIPGHSLCRQCNRTIDVGTVEPWHEPDLCADCIGGNGWRRRGELRSG